AVAVAVAAATIVVVVGVVAASATIAVAVGVGVVVAAAAVAAVVVAAVAAVVVAAVEGFPEGGDRPTFRCNLFLVGQEATPPSNPAPDTASISAFSILDSDNLDKYKLKISQDETIFFVVFYSPFLLSSLF
ncbi:hypothetical protein ACJX0J_024622, partial [Zea mays]